MANLKHTKQSIPRGPSATAAKNRYRDNNYDRAELAMQKGTKALVREIAKQQGQSFNEYVSNAIKEKIERDTGETIELYRNAKTPYS